MAVVLALTLTVVLPAVVGAEDAPAPPPVPPAGSATPVVTSAGNDTLTEYLELAPDVLANASPDKSLVLVFGDAQAQLHALGAAAPTSADSQDFKIWMQATQDIALPDMVLTRGLTPEFADLFGFDLLQVDSGMTVGALPDTITFLRGRFDQDKLRAAWQKSGYKQVDANGEQVYSLAAEPTVDLNSEIGQLVLSRFNNAAILTDGTVVFTPSLDLMRQVVDVTKGTRPSLAQNSGVAALVSSLTAPLASAILLQGSGLKLDDMISMNGRAPAEAVAKFRSDVEATGKLAPAKLALFGVTPGGPLPALSAGGGTPPAPGPNAVFVIHLLMADQAAAKAAMPVITKRLKTLMSVRTQQPYTDLVTLQDITVSADAPVVAIKLGFAPDQLAGLWTKMIFSNDLLFIAWEE